MEGFRLFAPIAKVDAQKRLVYGVAASEHEDKSGERFDYESSAPEFRKWSAEIAKGSGGKSLGNVRIMHQPIVAGVLTDLDCNDVRKAISVCAKIISDEAWKMVEAGAYTGFSIGGRYAKRWSDSEDPGVKWYTAIPSEISLVDNPCNPDAYFELVKLGGAIERRSFVGGHTGLRPRVASRGVPLAAPDKDDVFAHTVHGVVQRWLAKDGSPHVAKAAAMARNHEIEAEEAARMARESAALGHALTDADRKADDAPGDGQKPYGDVEYADPGWQKDRKRRYPIDTERHIRAAWSYIHRPRNARRYLPEQLAEIERRILAAWKKKIDSEGPPEASEEEQSRKFAKHLADAGQLASIILDLKALEDRLQLEADIEGDNSPQPVKAQAIIAELCGFLQALVAEETQEVIEDEEASQISIPQSISLAMPAGELAMRLEAARALSPRHTRQDQALLDLAHHAIRMAQAMSGLSHEDGEHLERASEHLMQAGANVGVLHQGPRDSEKMHGGHKAMIGTAHALISRVRGTGGHPQEMVSHLEIALEHLRTAGAEEEQQHALVTRPKFAGDLPRLDPGIGKGGERLEALAKVVRALTERAASGAEELAKLAQENQALKARLEKIEKEPLPAKTVRLPPGISRVEKAADGLGASADTDLADRIARMGEEERAMLFIKASYRNPLRPLFAGPETPQK
jgi:Family of unknown function (DUF6582)